MNPALYTISTTITCGVPNHHDGLVAHEKRGIILHVWGHQQVIIVPPRNGLLEQRIIIRSLRDEPIRNNLLGIVGVEGPETCGAQNYSHAMLTVRGLSDPHIPVQGSALTRLSQLPSTPHAVTHMTPTNVSATV